MQTELLEAILTELKGLNEQVKVLREEMAARGRGDRETGAALSTVRVDDIEPERVPDSKSEGARCDAKRTTFRSEHEAVFWYMLLPKEKKGLGLTREQASKACRMLKEGQTEWNRFKLGALLYALSQVPLPEDPIVFARGCRDGKSGAREDFQESEKKAQRILDELRKRIVLET